jgi:hypothetical protein
MLTHKPLDFVHLIVRETAVVLQPDRFEPEFGLLPLTQDVHVGRLRSIARIEEQPVRAALKDCRAHNSILSAFCEMTMEALAGYSRASVGAVSVGCVTLPVLRTPNGSKRRIAVSSSRAPVFGDLGQLRFEIDEVGHGHDVFSDVRVAPTMSRLSP